MRVRSCMLLRSVHQASHVGVGRWTDVCRQAYSTGVQRTSSTSQYPHADAVPSFDAASTYVAPALQPACRGLLSCSRCVNACTCARWLVACPFGATRVHEAARGSYLICEVRALPHRCRRGCMAHSRRASSTGALNLGVRGNGGWQPVRIHMTFTGGFWAACRPVGRGASASVPC